MRQHYASGEFQRAGNTKTHGIVRGEFTELRTFRAWVRFAGPGPASPPYWELSRLRQSMNATPHREPTGDGVLGRAGRGWSGSEAGEVAERPKAGQEEVRSRP